MGNFCSHPHCDGDGYMQSGVDAYLCTSCYDKPLPQSLKLMQTYDFYGEAWDFTIWDVSENKEVSTKTAFSKKDAIELRASLIEEYGKLPETLFLAHPDIEWSDFV